MLAPAASPSRQGARQPAARGGIPGIFDKVRRTSSMLDTECANMRQRVDRVGTTADRASGNAGALRLLSEISDEATELGKCCPQQHSWSLESCAELFGSVVSALQADIEQLETTLTQYGYEAPKVEAEATTAAAATTATEVDPGEADAAPETADAANRSKPVRARAKTPTLSLRPLSLGSPGVLVPRERGWEARARTRARWGRLWLCVLRPHVCVRARARLRFLPAPNVAAAAPARSFWRRRAKQQGTRTKHRQTERWALSAASLPRKKSQRSTQRRWTQA